MECEQRASRVLGGQRLELVEAAVGPGRERRADLRLERVVAAEDRLRLAEPLVSVEPLCPFQGAGLEIGANAEVECERRLARARLRRCRYMITRRDDAEHHCT